MRESPRHAHGFSRHFNSREKHFLLDHRSGRDQNQRWNVSRSLAVCRAPINNNEPRYRQSSRTTNGIYRCTPPRPACLPYLPRTALMPQTTRGPIELRTIVEITHCRKVSKMKTGFEAKSGLGAGARMQYVLKLASTGERIFASPQPSLGQGGPRAGVLFATLKCYPDNRAHPQITSYIWCACRIRVREAHALRIPWILNRRRP